MKWRNCFIGEYVDAGTADIQTGPFGTQLKASDYVSEGTPVINVRNIGFGNLRADKLEYVGEQTTDRLSAHLLHQCDIVFGRKGAVDRHLLVTTEHENWMQGSDCIRLRFETDDLNPRFVSYAFLRHEHQQWMLTQAGNKATMASLNQDIIKRIPIPVPPRLIQDSVVSILSAYDDLIDNNQRRIKLLEDAARTLYREWFVRLRFPGHEHTKIVDGVPEGWKQDTLESVCVRDIGIQTGPFGSQLHQSDYAEEGVPVLMPRDIAENRISLEQISRVPEAIAERLDRHRFFSGDVVYGRRGDIGRRAYISDRQAGWLCGTGCLRLRPNRERVTATYFFDALGHPETEGTIVGRAKGATMPNLNASIMASVPVLVPSLTIQRAYESFVAPTVEQIQVLDEVVRKLTSARDLLLPRLMNGEINI